MKLFTIDGLYLVDNADYLYLEEEVKCFSSEDHILKLKENPVFFFKLHDNNECGVIQAIEVSNYSLVKYQVMGSNLRKHIEKNKKEVGIDFLNDKQKKVLFEHLLGPK
jgi:hypothetical protein